MPLSIVICGAGLGGLSAAISCALAHHNVVVLEAAKELSEIGAGLQITPNGAKLLRTWGIGDEIDKSAAVPTSCIVHRYTGKILALEESFDRKLKDKFSEPFLDIHRADLQRMLYRRALSLGVDVRLNSRVNTINQRPDIQVVLGPGQSVSCDLVIGADGLWSKCRECMLGVRDDPLPTGDLAYRIVLTVDQIKDPELKDWVKQAKLHFWIGPDSHVVAYSMRNGTMYNIVLLVPDNLPDGVSRQSGSLDEMRALFEDWDPVLTKFLECVETVEKWRLMHRRPLETWKNADDNFVLIGDACHPMLPYLAQGANSSLEDGAVLGRILNHLNRKDQLPLALNLYQRLRKERGDAIAAETFKQRDAFHLPDGPEQMARDKIFEEQLGREVTSPFPSRWTDPDSQKWLYGYDAIQEADRAVAELQQDQQTRHRD